jgi:hypothetical protein
VAAAIPLEKRYTVDEDTGCWLWVGKRTADGRGEFMRNGRRYYGYRVFYEMANGPIPEGLVIDHRCENPPCVNPEHLEAVPQRINARRGGAAKLTEEQVAEIRASDELQRVLAERYGVAACTISNILAGRRWA